MKLPTLTILAMALAAVMLIAPAAQAGISVYYSSGGSWGVRLGYRSYRHRRSWPAYRSYYYGAHYPTYRYRVLSLPRATRLLRVVPGTVYTYDAYPTYSTSYPYTYTVASPVVTTAYATPTTVTATATSSTPASTYTPRPQPTRPITINVNVNGQNRPDVVTVERETPSQSATPAPRSWSDGQWRVPMEPQTEDSANAVSRKPAQAPARPAVETQSGYVRELERGDDASRLHAATELKRFDTPTSVAALVDALAKDGYVPVRKAAAESLGHMLAYKARSSLWEAARGDADADVRRTARAAAQKIDAFYDLK